VTSVTAPASTPSRRPNILVFLPDEQSVHALGCYGNRVVASPYVDALAAQGVTLDAAYCNYPLCVPSRLSLLSGKHPHKIDAWDNRSILDPGARTFAADLTAAGYRTCLIGKMHLAGEEQRYGFEQRPYGDLLGWSHQPDPPRTAHGLSRIAAGSSEIPLEQTQEEIVNREAVAFLRRHRERDPDRPFLLVLGYNRPHFPLRPPLRWWERYWPGGYDLPEVPAGHVERLHPWIRAVRHRSDGDGFTAEQTARARAGYYACVSYVDEKVGEILQELDALGLAEHTLVVYTSDHGEMMGDHDMWGKRTFYEGSARVPFVVRWPGHLPAGTRASAPVELVDLYPTLCAAAGVAPPGDLDGDSLLPLLAGDTASWRAVAVSDYCQWLPAPARMVRRGAMKLNYYTGAGFELFDLDSDPDELHDLSAEPAQQATLRELLPYLGRAGWSPPLAEALWREYQRRGPRFPRRHLRTPNQFWAEGPPYRDAEDFYPADIDWERVPIRP
jgi:choline-sulfatase